MSLGDDLGVCHFKRQSDHCPNASGASVSCAMIEVLIACSTEESLPISIRTDSAIRVKAPSNKGKVGMP